MKDKLIIISIVLCAVMPIWSQGLKFDPRNNNVSSLMYRSVVKIVAEKDVGRLTYTGVIFGNTDFGTMRTMVTVLTTKSLLECAKEIKIEIPMRMSGKDRMLQKIVIAYGAENIFYECHPDRTVDLCAIIISKEIGELDKQGKTLDYYLESSILANEEFFKKEKPLDPIVMVGHPYGLMDEVNPQPIFRRGVYATDPSLDYNGRREFLIDVTNSGNLGGFPVFRFDDKMYNDRSGFGITITLASRLTLLGISSVEYANAIPVNGVNDHVVRVLKASRIKELQEYLKKRYCYETQKKK